MKTKEEIIRSEAQQFAKHKIYVSNFNIPEYINEVSNEVKIRLLDFHFDEYRAFFLDELLSEIPKQVASFKKKFQASDWSYLDFTTDKLLFYIQQEIDILPKIAHIKSSNNADRKKVFISYSHADRVMVDDLLRHFKPFKDIVYWNDQKIQPGQKWKDEIINALNETKVAILLVSADFFASDFITNHELPPLLAAADKDGATILTVILKPVVFEAFPEINRYQAMNSPNNPVIRMSEADREELWANVFRNTKKAIETN